MDRFAGFPQNEQRLYFEQTGERMRLSPHIVEKDFWVSWTLSELFALPDIGKTLIFKGGTSLSKAYRMIERFSEDIDVSIDRASLGFGEDCDPEADISNKERRRRIALLGKACQERIENELWPAMTGAIESRLGTARGWSLRMDEDDPDGQTLIFEYPSGLTGAFGGYVKPVVKIEMGARSDHWPCDMAQISPYVAEQFPDAFQSPRFAAKVLTAERTFWEKVTMLHAEYHRPDDKKMPMRLSRHYYDVAQMIRAGLGERALENLELLQRVVTHKKAFFQSGWARYDDAKQGSLRLVPNVSRMKDLEDDYDRMREMFFTAPPGFREVLAALAEWEDKFNHMI
jgi:predicted nucleotidyltransferase component of viral defense system